MPDDSDEDRGSLVDRARGRLAAALAPTQDNDASPQARDEEPTTVGREAFREEVDADAIETFVEEYYQNPLIRVPIRNFAADVTEPGVSVIAGTPDGDDIPTVPGRAASTYAGEPLDTALEGWLGRAYIDGFSFDSDGADLLEEVVKDRRGRRGTAIVEHAYDDPRERQRLLGLRPVKVETTTAYTREGKAIALRPDDDPGEFDTVAVRNLGQATRESAPTTPAGKTAAIAQFDEVFGSDERDEIPFALDDLTISTHDADTGALFGKPDSAPIINRATALRKQLRYVDQSVVNTAFGNILATVESQDEDVVKGVRDNLDVNVRDRGEESPDPETVSVTNAPVDVIEIEGQVPDVVDIIQQEIEYILTAMPTPLYRVGFAGDINRDITGEQREDYRDAVKRERRRLEADFQDILEQKARELLHDDAHAEESLDVDVELRIRPEQSESPLRDEEFDAGEFAELMSGLSTAAGPKGGATALISEETIIETFLDMDPDGVLDATGNPAPDAVPARLGTLDESDPRVREAFDEFTGASLATHYQEGDVVQSPQGLGVVTGVETEPFTGKNDEEINASSSSPTYIVGLKDARIGVGFYSASELSETEMPDTGVDDPKAALVETDTGLAREVEIGGDDAEPSTTCRYCDERTRTFNTFRCPTCHPYMTDEDHPPLATASADEIEEWRAALAETTFGIPDSWEESPKPNRLILLDAWSSMGGTFRGARQKLGSKRLAASMKDRVLQWEGWR